MDRRIWKARFECTMLAITLALALLAAPRTWATIPDANIVSGVNRGGFGVFEGAYGQADFSISERSAVGGYFGFDDNNLYFDNYGPGDHTFNDDLIMGGHYMYQFVEGNRSEPSIAGIFGAFANRAGLRPEFGIAISHDFDAKWSGRANLVYGPSWGFEVGYRFTPTVEGTFGITGLGAFGLGFRF